jgi:hypothetical protein
MRIGRWIVDAEIGCQRGKIRFRRFHTMFFKAWVFVCVFFRVTALKQLTEPDYRWSQDPEVKCHHGPRVGNG